MSWNYYGIGKPRKVYEQAVKQLEGQTERMSDPENTVVQLFLDQLLAITEAMPESSVIKVMASGSQWDNRHTETYTPKGIFNNLKIEIEPVYGFVE